MLKRLGIVGSWEKGPDGKDISLEKFQSTGDVEIYAPVSEYLDFSLARGMPVELIKEGHFWKGEIVLSRTGYLTGSSGFSPRNFAQAIGNNPVGVYIVRLSRETPVMPEIIGATAYLA